MPEYGSVVPVMFGDEPRLPAEYLEQGYRDAVQYLSDVYRSCYESLTDRYDYVITVGDHGELFQEDGWLGHNQGIYPEVTRVPIVIYRLGYGDETRDDLVSLLDVHATIKHLTALP